MNARKYVMSFGPDEADELSEAKYAEIAAAAAAAYETPEEYAGYAFLGQAVNEAGETVWLGVK